MQEGFNTFELKELNKTKNSAARPSSDDDRRSDETYGVQEYHDAAEHIAELRKRILLVVAVFILSMVAGLIAAPHVLSMLKHHSPAFQVTWNVFSPWDGLRIYMSISIVLSSLPTLPFALYQIWLFVNQGLNNREQRAALRFIPFSALCFLIGVAFAYFVVFPMSLAFTTGINSQMDLVETYGVAQYFGFMFNIIIPLSLAFERRCRPVSDANRNIKPGYPAYDEALCLRRSGDHCGADLAARSRISPDGCHPAHRPV